MMQLEDPVTGLNLETASTDLIAKAVITRFRELRAMLTVLSGRPQEELDQAFGAIAKQAGPAEFEISNVESRVKRHWHHSLMSLALQYPVRAEIRLSRLATDGDVQITWNGHSCRFKEGVEPEDLQQSPGDSAHLIGAFISESPALATRAALALAEGRSLEEAESTALDRAYVVMCDFVENALEWAGAGHRGGVVNIRPVAPVPVTTQPTMMAP